MCKVYQPPARLCVLFLLLFLLVPLSTFSQTPQWALSLSSSGSDEGFDCKTAPNGNVVIAGKFSNIIDLDPSAAVYNITSHGSEDMFLACYTSSGTFLWGFNIGGSDIDAIFDIAFDASSNVFACGYFRGQNVDFDPSPAVNAISDNGLAGGNPPYGGDGFLAKYSATGAFQWAFGLGGQYVYDFTQGLATDELGNVYVDLWFTGVVDVDPSPAVNNVSSLVSGKIGLLKYSPSGQLIWDKICGTPGGAGIDDGVRQIVYKQGFLYLVGFYQGTADFDPSPANASLTSSGTYDAFVAKYDSSGQLIFVRDISGTGATDEARGIALDSANNIYVTGYTTSVSLTFQPSITVNAPGGGGNQDIFLARYDNTGTPQWAHIIGSAQGNDIGHSLTVVGNKLYCSGAFTGTVDFDPAAAVTNLICNGSNSDMYLATYDLNGNYKCGFNIGGTNVFDEGYRLNSDPFGYLYLTGGFNGTGVDLDPGPATFAINGNANGDAFLVKYDMTTGSSGNSLTGGTFCNSLQATLTFTSSSGPGPYTVTYTDGNNTYTQNNVTSGVPFNLSPNPASTTTYTLISPLAANGICGTATNQVTALVSIVPRPTANAGVDTTICAGTQYHLNGTGGGTYQWSPPGSVNNATIANPLVTATSNTIFTLVVSNGGCSDTDQVVVNISPTPIADAGDDTAVCTGAKIMLHGTGGNSYYWYSGSFTSNSQDTVVNISETTTFYLTVTGINGCRANDSIVVTAMPPPQFSVLSGQVQKCIQDSVMLVAGGGDIYSWTPTTAISNIAQDSVIVWPSVSTTYYVTITDTNCNYSETLPVDVAIRSLPDLHVSSREMENCNGKYLQLSAAGATTYSWIPANGVSSPGSATTIVIADTLTYFTVFGTDAFGCLGTTTVTAQAPAQEHNYFYAPNAFTPNDDGTNDCYRIRITGPVLAYELHIYDRFGNEVFTTTNTLDCWDGNYKGQPMDVGTYYYFYKAELPGCPGLFNKGDFHLLR